jgi:hypothetical protein
MRENFLDPLGLGRGLPTVMVDCLSKGRGLQASYEWMDMRWMLIIIIIVATAAYAAALRESVLKYTGALTDIPMRMLLTRSNVLGILWS